MPSGVYKRRPETREKMRLAHLGEKNHNYGKKMSDEQRLKLSLAKIGKPSNSKGHKRADGGFWKGKKRPDVSGDKCSLWRGGTTKVSAKIRGSPEYKSWRESVFKRDDYTCQKTKEKGVYLVVHHIKNFSEFPDLRFNIDNGITLSRKAHYEFHKRYGRKNNTREQIEEFLLKD